MPRLSMLDHALRYAAQGWPVFPCDPNDKRPLVPGSAKDAAGKKIPETGGLYYATTDEATIRAWWRTRRNAMIGVRAGLPIGAFVLDLDACTDAKTGEVFTAESIKAEIEALLGVELPETLTSKTPRGGWHMLYAMPDDVVIGNSRGALKAIEHLDVRGGVPGHDNSGYIIVAPSMRSGPKAVDEGCDGVAYRWLDPDAPITEAPPRLIDALLARGDFAPKAPAATPKPHRMEAAAFSSAVEEARRKYVDAALDKAYAAIAGAVKGTRNETINSWSLWIGHHVGAGGISHAEAYSHLEAAARASGTGPRAFGPNGTIARALEKGAEQPADYSQVGARAGQGKSGGARLAPPPVEDERAGYGSAGAADLRNQDRGDDLKFDRGISVLRGASQELTPPDDAFAPLDLPDDGEGEGVPSGAATEVCDPETIAFCAGLDTSDTDNAVRLIRHFGEDLIVQAQEGTAGGEWGCWSGRHWDFPNGATRATLLAQRVGDRIALETAFIRPNAEEQKALEAAKPFKGQSLRTLGEEDKEIVLAAREAEKQVKRRKQRRLTHGVTTKNAGRIKSFMDMAAPKLRRPTEAFNADRHAVACLTHTLRFSREEDADCNPDGSPRHLGEIKASAGHAREDLITAIVPVEWQGLEAPAPKLRAFLDQMLPDREKQRTVQQFAGLGMLALPIQFVMFHYGSGANGKSVFLEALSRVLGPSIAVGLPKESIMGVAERSAGGASPDIARLWGKRMLRVNELKDGELLQADLIKRMTGGESFPVRTLFKGYFEFQNVASVHMSANGFPRFDGSDYGMARRLLAVHWDQTVPEGQRRDFEEMVSELVSDGPGFLAWLAEGVRDFMAAGKLYIAESVRADTADYVLSQAPVQQFAEACVVASPGNKVQGAEMGEAYNRWAAENGKNEMKPNTIGKLLQKALRAREGWPNPATKEITGRTFYMDCALQNVPPARGNPATPQERF